MSIIAELVLPCSDKEKQDFIVKYNHQQGCTIEKTEDKWIAVGLVSVEELAPLREAEFQKHFFEIPAVGTIFKGGWYRKQPKGYSSATESINTAFNLVNMIGSLPKDSLIFYTKPDFSDEEQCSEEWLIANQFRNEAWSKEDFAQFYYAFVTGWNAQEHA
jgi:hypothetical protein